MREKAILLNQNIEVTVKNQSCCDKMTDEQDELADVYQNFSDARTNFAKLLYNFPK